MLDIKLRNRHKLAVVLIICTIVIPGLYTMDRYGTYYKNIWTEKEDIQENILTSEDFLENFIELGFILYNTEKDHEDIGVTEAKHIFREYFPYINVEYEALYPYLDYRAEDEKGAVVDASTANTERILTKQNIDSYALGLVVTYDENGNPDIERIYGEYGEEQSVALRRIFGDSEGEWQSFISDGEEFGLSAPENRTYYYAMTKENLAKYVDNQYFDDYQVMQIPDGILNLQLILMLFVAVTAWTYPRFSSLRTGNEKIFLVPFEAVVIAAAVAAAVADAWSQELIFRSSVYEEVWGQLYLILIFAMSYWVSACLRQIYVLRPAEYIRERTILYPSWKYIKCAWNALKNGVKKGISGIYRSLEQIDFTKRSNKAILKIVTCNFIILILVCMMWFYGIMALIIYSVILFFILRKYYNDLQEKYRILLKATNQIAEGNLDVEIVEDLGVFTPFRTEIAKIQTGFKKAVAEEVKSQRMKTELITNVSHDLKTPLTAIITYVNLLKEEKDEKKRKDYVAILERKSLRLKVLIEDLFEISKVSSNNITLDIVDVDIVDLFKQVKLELEDKFKEAEIDFRVSYPEDKLLVPLDSQKTYRIFENLLVNISKYAMPHTRAYVEILREGEEAVVRIKNISAAELTFNPEEITERFVRGDASRNTEGSGLGLAIAKSFTELQKGKFVIETEADLFKAELRFRASPPGERSGMAN